MHFYAQNAVPGLYEGRNGRLQKIAAKNGGYTPGITVIDAGIMVRILLDKGFFILLQGGNIL